MTQETVPPSKFRQCSRCNRKFVHRAACENHIRDYHHGIGEPIKATKKVKKKIEHEQSEAEILIEATYANACGEDVPEYLIDMYPEAFLDD